MRLIEPASKRRTVELLSHYFGITYSKRVYQDIPKLLKQNSLNEQYAFRVAIEKFNETFYFLLYDVTTLYFETFQSDELRIPGFSKDNKSQQPRIVVWLLVTQSSFPLVYEVFPGNTFEGKTMLPVLDNFMNEHKDIKPIVATYAALLSEERLTELPLKNISYIVGARLATSNLDLVKQIHSVLENKNGKMLVFPLYLAN